MRPLIIGALLMLGLAGCLGGDGNDRPGITTQPADTNVVSGSTATFSVVTTGKVDLLQWQRSSNSGASWLDIAGAASATHTTSATTLADDGLLFRVLVRGGGTTLTSSAARLGVTNAVVAPQITVQPEPRGVQQPAAATFSITATGTSLTYQWQNSANGTDWAAIAGATASSYDTGPTNVSMNGLQHRVVVGNSAGSIASLAVPLWVEAPPAVEVAPTFTEQPADQAVTAGSTATFNVTVAGTPTPTLQWQRSDNAGGSWSDIALASGASYTTAAASSADHDARFRVLAANSAGNATSDPATLTVNPAPVAPFFTSQPQDASVTEGTAASFSAAASGTPTPTYQWQVSTDGGATWSNIIGATGSTYALGATTLAHNARRYRAVAGNSAGTVDSNAATLTVTADTGCGAVDRILVSTSGSPTYGPYTEDALCVDRAEHGSRQVRLEEQRSIYHEVLVVDYDPASGTVIRASYYAGQMGAGTAWRCDPDPVFGPPCDGIGLSPSAGSVTFSGTAMREFVSGETVSLDGSATFPPRP